MGYLRGKGPPDLESTNKGELVAICAHVGLAGHRGMSREELRALLEGTSTEEQSSPVNGVRDRTVAFLKLYWELVKNQLAEGCSGNCYDCSDAKALACFRENADHLFG